VAHKEAVMELAKMRAEMEQMESEREQLVAEVELQIERALHSMTLSMEMSDSEEDGSQVDENASASASSRPQSKLGRHSRASSNAVGSSPRTQSIDSATLAGTTEAGESVRHSLDADAIKEEDENESTESPTAPNNIDATAPVDRTMDTMVAVDEGIHSNSDRIAQSVLQIQQKVMHFFYNSEREQ
jgi:EEF1A N-terminal glycine/lysine methyltransferase